MTQDLPSADPAKIDDRALLSKARGVVRRLGVDVVEKVLVGYYVMRDDATPRRARLTLAGALAYFLLPADAVADVLPAVGFTDDGLAIAMALAAVATSIRQRHLEQARTTLQGWGLAPRGSTPPTPPVTEPTD